MESNDLQLLASIPDRAIAEEIQGFLEAANIYTLLASDNPASSVMNAYMGSSPMENIDIQINTSDYQQAIELLSDSPYKKIISKD